MTATEFIDLVIDTIEDYKHDLEKSDNYFIERICDIVNAYKDGTVF